MHLTGPGRSSGWVSPLPQLQGFLPSERSAALLVRAQLNEALISASLGPHEAVLYWDQALQRIVEQVVTSGFEV